MERNLKHFALIIGFILLIASMVFSFQGFNFNFTGTNDFWTIVFWVIGTSLTASVSILELIFNTDYKNLNATLKAAGILAYFYSIYTNHAGLVPFVNIDGSDRTTWVIAVFLDVLPEPMIAWSLGESLKGDLVGNILKWLKPPQPQQAQSKQEKKNIPYPQKTDRAYNAGMFDKLPKKPYQDNSKKLHPVTSEDESD